MKHLFTAIACCLTVAGSTQGQYYNPDVDGDGCITVADVLGVLSLFDTCDEGTTLYYFHDNPSMHPMGSQLNIDSFGTQTWWLTDENGEWFESTDFEAFFEWTMSNQGNSIAEIAVMEVDSVLNVTVPLAQSIPFGSITMPEITSSGYYFFVISHEVNFPFDEIPVFWQPGVNLSSPSPLQEWEFEWQGGMWSLYQVLDYSPTSASATFEVDGCY